MLRVLHSLLDSDSDRDGSAYHRVVAHADKTHHLNVCGNGGGACELRIGVHTAHGVGHAVRGRTCSHVVGVAGTACSAAGSDREVLNAVLYAPLLVGACDGVLEAGRVGGVAGDGNADILELHDSNALGNIISAVALNVRARALGVCGLGDDLYRLGVRIKLGST